MQEAIDTELLKKYNIIGRYVPLIKYNAKENKTKEQEQEKKSVDKDAEALNDRNGEDEDRYRRKENTAAPFYFVKQHPEEKTAAVLYFVKAEREEKPVKNRSLSILHLKHGYCVYKFKKYLKKSEYKARILDKLKREETPSKNRSLSILPLKFCYCADEFKKYLTQPEHKARILDKPKREEKQCMNRSLSILHLEHDCCVDPFKKYLIPEYIYKASILDKLNADSTSELRYSSVAVSGNLQCLVNKDLVKIILQTTMLVHYLQPVYKWEGITETITEAKNQTLMEKTSNEISRINSTNSFPGSQNQIFHEKNCYQTRTRPDANKKKYREGAPILLHKGDTNEVHTIFIDSSSSDESEVSEESSEISPWCKEKAEEIERKIVSNVPSLINESREKPDIEGKNTSLCSTKDVQNTHASFLSSKNKQTVDKKSLQKTNNRHKHLNPTSTLTEKESKEKKGIVEEENDEKKYFVYSYEDKKSLKLGWSCNHPNGKHSQIPAAHFDFRPHNEKNEATGEHDLDSSFSEESSERSSKESFNLTSVSKDIQRSRRNQENSGRIFDKTKSRQVTPIPSKDIYPSTDDKDTVDNECLSPSPSLDNTKNFGKAQTGNRSNISENIEKLEETAKAENLKGQNEKINRASDEKISHSEGGLTQIMFSSTDDTMNERLLVSSSPNLNFKIFGNVQITIQSESSKNIERLEETEKTKSVDAGKLNGQNDNVNRINDEKIFYQEKGTSGSNYLSTNDQEVKSHSYPNPSLNNTTNFGKKQFDIRPEISENIERFAEFEEKKRNPVEAAELNDPNKKIQRSSNETISYSGHRVSVIVYSSKSNKETVANNKIFSSSSSNLNNSTNFENVATVIRCASDCNKKIKLDSDEAIPFTFEGITDRTHLAKHDEISEDEDGTLRCFPSHNLKNLKTYKNRNRIRFDPLQDIFKGISDLEKDKQRNPSANAELNELNIITVDDKSEIIKSPVEEITDIYIYSSDEDTLDNDRTFLPKLTRHHN
ncbi:hypothetical protein TNIN_225961 [Trichonephila inaurata madagascariensis]|uniref:Uncharacterized protein n=1 Tax=Trichonephila inaurata madagascariensis TaxID=2747483 RepID=A0A8X6XRI9_9ARAC|nr:hypothetical protein TNIN_225961 [Trichonephila inaurata madagascariensis]